MKKYFFQIASFAFLLVSCSSDSAKDATDEIKMETKTSKNYEYVNIDGVYQLINPISNVSSTIIKIDGEKVERNYVDSTEDIPKEQLGEYTTYEITEISENHISLLYKMYAVKDNYKINETWNVNCEITKGTLEDFNNGETIVVKSLNVEESNRVSEVLIKGIMVKTIPNIDPYQTSIKFNSYNNIFLISKNKIIKTSNSSMTASIKVLKEVKE